MNRQQSQDIILRIAGSYTQFETTGEIGKKRIEMWTSHLKDMPYERVLERLNQHIRENRFPPTIAEIAYYPPGKNQVLQDMEEWEKEAQAFRQTDKYKRMKAELREKYGQKHRS